MHLAQSPLLPTVLYVDDDAPNRQAFGAAFRRQFKVILAASMQEAWDILAGAQVHVIISDQRMPGTPGSELLHLVRERYPRVRRMLMTAYSDIQAVIDAVNRGGVTQYIPKPWDPSQVVQAVMQAFGEVREEEERSTYTEQLQQVNRQLEFALRQRLLS